MYTNFTLLTDGGGGTPRNEGAGDPGTRENGSEGARLNAGGQSRRGPDRPGTSPNAGTQRMVGSLVSRGRE